MDVPFDDLRGLDPKLVPLREELESAYSELGELFDQLASSDKRLKPLPAMPMPSLSAPHEFAALQSLRAISLTDGVVALIARSNWVAAYPVLRSLFEVWIAIFYADIMFRRLVVEQSRWQRFNEISGRLLRGQTIARDAGPRRPPPSPWRPATPRRPKVPSPQSEPSRPESSTGGEG